MQHKQMHKKRNYIFLTDNFTMSNIDSNPTFALNAPGSPTFA